MITLPLICISNYKIEAFFLSALNSIVRQPDNRRARLLIDHREDGGVVQNFILLSGSDEIFSFPSSSGSLKDLNVFRSPEIDSCITDHVMFIGIEVHFFFPQGAYYSVFNS